MKTPLQTISLSAFIVLVASCSIPVIDRLDFAQQTAPAASPPPTAVAPFDFHRQAPVTPCGSAGCKRPTLKTLAVDRSSESSPQTSLQLQPAAAKLLNEVHKLSAADPATSPQTPARNASERELSLYFDYASATLGLDARAQLDEAMNRLVRPHRISIRGRTDGHGATPANQRLALARAQAVRQHLLSRDPSLSEVIELEARGSCCYVAPNVTPSGRALNRRVEITLMRLDTDA